MYMNIVIKKDKQFTESLRYVIKHINKASRIDLSDLQEAVEKERKQEKLYSLKALFNYMIEHGYSSHTFYWNINQEDDDEIRDRNIISIMEEIAGGSRDIVGNLKNISSDYLRYYNYKEKSWKVKVRCNGRWEGLEDIVSIKINIELTKNETIIQNLD